MCTQSLRANAGIVDRSGRSRGACVSRCARTARLMGLTSDHWEGRSRYATVPCSGWETPPCLAAGVSPSSFLSSDSSSLLFEMRRRPPQCKGSSVDPRLPSTCPANAAFSAVSAADRASVQKCSTASTLSNFKNDPTKTGTTSSPEAPTAFHSNSSLIPPVPPSPPSDGEANAAASAALIATGWLANDAMRTRESSVGFPPSAMASSCGGAPGISRGCSI
mmetsp:Transcript_36426/g.90864  ORF Transcript_36426/g.90864 Transcript_36426/m.90864 type:complete len:220 (+) Transcript_36426:361-1020(+)